MSFPSSRVSSSPVNADRRILCPTRSVLETWDETFLLVARAWPYLTMTSIQPQAESELPGLHIQALSCLVRTLRALVEWYMQTAPQAAPAAALEEPAGGEEGLQKDWGQLQSLQSGTLEARAGTQSAEAPGTGDLLTFHCNDVIVAVSLVAGVKMGLGCGPGSSGAIVATEEHVGTTSLLVCSHMRLTHAGVCVLA